MRKTFKHDFVTEVSLTSVTTDSGRRYQLPNGHSFPSVTTVLNNKLDKTGLMEWKAKVGEEKAAQISTQAARRGTAVHSLAENYVLNKEDYAKGAMPINVFTFQQIKKMLDEHVDNIKGVELPLYSYNLNAAGRTDLIAEFDGELSIVDFKTSRKPKKEEWIESYFLQTTAYAVMFEEIYKVHVPKLAILVAVDDEEPQIFFKDKSVYIPKLLKVFS